MILIGVQHFYAAEWKGYAIADYTFFKKLFYSNKHIEAVVTKTLY